MIHMVGRLFHDEPLGLCDGRVHGVTALVEDIADIGGGWVAQFEVEEAVRGPE